MRWTMAIRVFLSTRVRSAWSLDLWPRTVSISQCPNSSRVSIDSGLSSMLVPRTFLLPFDFEDFVLRRSFKTRSIFFTFRSPLSIQLYRVFVQGTESNVFCFFALPTTTSGDQLSFNIFSSANNMNSHEAIKIVGAPQFLLFSS